MLNEGILFVALSNDSISGISSLINKLKTDLRNEGIKLVVLFNSDIYLSNYSFLVWLTLGNIDPVRNMYQLKLIIIL